ncbi:retrovirus-related pol polyprotein from transposon TNT 1-94 [Tanacetum coccineum]
MKILSSLDYDHEMVPKSKDWVERHNPDCKLTNFNIGRILVPESQDVASPSSESVLGPLIVSDTEPITSPIPTEFKNTEQKLKINELTKLVQMLIDEKVNSSQKTQESKFDIPKTESSKSDDSSKRHIREPIWYQDSGSSRSMTGVKSYLHKYIEKSGPKFDDKQGTIFNANKEIMLIAPRRNDVYVLDMSSLTPNRACFFAKASESINWLWHKRLSHLNFKNINKLPKQNKCLHILHMVLFGPVKPMSINHEKYTLVIVDEYSRMVENQNDVKVKQIRTNNGTKFRNSKLKSFCDEKGISQNFSSPYIPKQNGLAEKKNITLIEATRTICPAFMHNHKDHLGKFEAKADDEYFLGYLFYSKSFRVFNTRRQQIKETYHVTFDESMEAIRFTNTPVDEIEIDDSSGYPLDEFHH